MSNADVAVSIVNPAASIAKSWVSITTKNGELHTGTIIKSDKKEIVLHNIAGVKTVIRISNMKKRGPGPESMIMHLVDNITLQEFANLIGYIKSLDSSDSKPKKSKK